MSFRDVLQRILQETPGARSATVMGFDGIAIESCDAETADGTEGATAVELAAVTTQLKRAAEGLGAGGVQEVTLATDGLVTVLRPLSSEYLVAMSLRPDGLVGKARYLMRVVAPELAAELG